MSRCVKGMNDLVTTHPNIAAEWHPDKNGDLLPCDIMAGSDKRVWWKCSLGHEWKTAVYHRKAGHGCPSCASRKALLKHGHKDLLSRDPVLAGEWNFQKNQPLTPDQIPEWSQMKVWWKCSLGHEWKTTVSKRRSGKGCPYCAGIKVLRGYNDLATTHPKLAAEWNQEKNGDLTSADVMAGTDRKVWWKCALGHEWKAAPYSRKAGHGCPYCAGNRLNPGVNDLSTLYPEILKSWDYERNGSVLPSQVAANSAQKAWWICSHGHSWEAAIYSRTSGGKNCPYCSSRKIMAGFNDLLSQNTQLCTEWDYEKNSSIRPDEVTEFSSIKVWWKCSLGHSWKTAIANRSGGSGCPFCNGKELLSGFNDLATSYPALIPEWNNTRNKNLKPSDVMPGSNKKVWWKCSLGHEWKSAVNSRTGKNQNGCPYCGNRRVWKGFNDLQTIYPEIAMEWDTERNNDLKADQVTYRSTKQYWWCCNKQHNWKASIYSRQLGFGCPYCSGKKAFAGFNDLQTKSAWLVDEWDWDRNGDITPESILPFTNRKAWWKCKNGHHWRSNINSRQKGIGCPYCSGRLQPTKHIVP